MINILFFSSVNSFLKVGTIVFLQNSELNGLVIRRINRDKLKLYIR